MPMSRLDSIYRTLVMSKFFSKGWGKPENLKRLFEFRKVMCKRESCFKLVPEEYPIKIVKKEDWSDCHVLEGEFFSPFADHMPGLVPKESETVHFQVLLPKKWRNNLKPMCVHLAGTGDHYYWRRRNLMAKPLLKEAGIGSIIVENPFYGLRKPKDQIRSNLHNVSDIFVMGGCLILESLVLFHWCEKSGYGPLGITGISMGGHMASLAATNWPKPLVLVPCLSWSTASGVFTQGVMSGAINWDMLMDQYYSNGKYREEIKKMLFFQEDTFRAGQHFAQNFPQSMDRIEELTSEERLLSQHSHGTTSHFSDQLHAPNRKRALLSVKEKNIAKSSLTRDAMKNISSMLDNNLNQSHEVLTKVSLRESLVDLTGQNENVEIKMTKKLKDGEVKMSEQSEEVKIKMVSSLGGHSVISNESGLLENSVKDQSVKTGLSDISSQKILSILSPSKLINTKNILASFHESKSRLLKKNGEQTPAKNFKEDAVRKEALQFMRGIMDECTHLKNFDIPVDTDLIIAVTAKDDGYVPQEGVTDLRDIWPGMEVRNLDAGHVSAYLLYQHTFRAAIVDAFDRAAKKYYN